MGDRQLRMSSSTKHITVPFLLYWGYPGWCGPFAGVSYQGLKWEVRHRLLLLWLPNPVPSTYLLTAGLTAPRSGSGKWAPLYMGALWLSFPSFSDSPLSAQEISLLFLPGSWKIAHESWSVLFSTLWLLFIKPNSDPPIWFKLWNQALFEFKTKPFLHQRLGSYKSKML